MAHKAILVLGNSVDREFVKRYYDVDITPDARNILIEFDVDENKNVRSSKIIISSIARLEETQFPHPTIGYGKWREHFIDSVPIDWNIDPEIKTRRGIFDSQADGMDNSEEANISEVEYEETRPVKYSLIVHSPSSDIDKAGREIVNITKAARSIDELVHGIGLYVPPYVAHFLHAAEAAGHYRAEILVGEMEYKFYIKP
jgi:hypothetical protein